jgi:hypothetical protein
MQKPLDRGRVGDKAGVSFPQVRNVDFLDEVLGA